MKAQIIKHSVNCYINNTTKVKECQNKKLGGLIVEKNIQVSLQNNSNNLISNLTGKTLSDTETETLKYGLKHGIATHPSEIEMIAIAENIWYKIDQKGLCNHFMKQERVKTTLRIITYSYVDIYNKQYSHDKKKIIIIKQLHEKYKILKPYKNNGVVLLNKIGYQDEVNQLLADKSKFKIIKNDPTLTRLKTVQNYLKNLYKRNEIAESKKKQMRPMSAQLGRTHGLPKICNVFANIPNFAQLYAILQNWTIFLINVTTAHYK